VVPECYYNHTSPFLLNKIVTCLGIFSSISEHECLPHTQSKVTSPLADKRFLIDSKVECTWSE